MSTNISWTDETWNPTTGCHKVSPGCLHCYAETLSLRRGWSTKPWTKPNADENVVTHEDRLTKPLSWKTPKRIFVNSMSDLFHENVPDEFICKVFTVMRRCSHHTFQVLTKRPERMMYFMHKLAWHQPEFGATGLAAIGQQAYLSADGSGSYIPPNIWLGTSIEDQKRADERLPFLLRTPAAIRFVSCEPLLAPVQIPRGMCERCGALSYGDPDKCLGCWQPTMLYKLHWVIAGGESGPNFRTMNLDWARSLRDQCQAQFQCFWFKQQSGFRPEGNPVLDGKQWREFPKVSVYFEPRPTLPVSAPA